ncbi:MAG TPA: J domain-containing protein [Acidimicrobiales bacterium]|nr:J domain-containing protein [Acidimicrobiales bacterium]
MTPYEVLGVDERASAGDIRRAYFRLARAHHPDFFAAADGATRADAERRMRAINAAWSILGDEARRLAYDRSAGQGPGQGDPTGEGQLFRPFDDGADDIDPRDVPDEPYRPGDAGGSRLGRVVTLVPVGAFAAAVALGALGLVVGSAGLIALAAASFVAACVGFVVMPLVALARATRNE